MKPEMTIPEVLALHQESLKEEAEKARNRLIADYGEEAVNTIGEIVAVYAERLGPVESEKLHGKLLRLTRAVFFKTRLDAFVNLRNLAEMTDPRNT